MKLICISLQENKPSIIYLKPDTALLRNGDAFYLPEFSDKTSARFVLIVKIKKMGKKVAEKFAHRYYDEVSIGLNIEDTHLLEANIKANLPWDEAVAFDYSAPIGLFIEKPEQFTLSLNVNKTEVASFDIEKSLIEKTIAEASQRFTLKIGDIAYIALPQEMLELSMGQKIEATLNKTELFRCDIK